MKFINTTKVLVLKKVTKEGFEDANKKYYSLLVMQEEDAGSISCSKEIFDAVKEGETVILVTTYNPDAQYESSKFRISGIVTPSAERTAGKA